MRYSVIIQARMGSSRLPGKSLAALGERPIIDWVVERVATGAAVDRVVVATSTNPEDDHLASCVEARGVATVFRGDPDDVLARFAGALRLVETDSIVRITGDCPLVHAPLIDEAASMIGPVDYVATGLDGRFPRGFDVECFTREALEIAAAEATDPVEREHVTPYIVRRPEQFRLAPLPCPAWLQFPELRVTLDEASDLDLLRAIVAELDGTPTTLDAHAVVDLLRHRPDLKAINADVQHRHVR